MAVLARASIVVRMERSIDSTAVYYLLQSSTLSPPAKPTTLPPGGNWVLQEPSYTSGRTVTLYRVEVTIYSDDTFDYSEVSQSSSYEAAKAAYNKATEAVEGVSTLRTSASAEEQIIYISKPSGTNSVQPYTTWVSQTGDVQNTWTLKRPTYSRSYPVLFLAKQRKNVAGTVTCTTPLKDDTTTVIDGGHITTGTIDASAVNVTNLNADNISSGALRVYDANNNLIFEADKDTKSVKIGGWVADADELKSTDSDSVMDMTLGNGRIKFISTSPSADDYAVISSSLQSMGGDKTGPCIIVSLSNKTSGNYITELLLRGGYNSPIAYDFTDFTSAGLGLTHNFYGKLAFRGDTAVSMTNPSVWRSAIGAVNKAGDTMAGNLIRQNSSVDTKDASNDISSGQWGGFQVTDKNGYPMSYFSTDVRPDGRTGTGMYVYNRDSSGNQIGSAVFELFMNKSGAVTYNLSNPAAFRDAIGIDAIDAPTVNTSIYNGSLDNNKWTSLKTVTFVPGVWLVVFHCEFGANASGRRCISFNTALPSSAAAYYTGTQVAAASGSKTIVHFTKIIKLTANTAYIFGAYQNSGTSLSAQASADYIKLCDL